VEFSGFILVNVYLPSVGTADRFALCKDRILLDIEFCLSSNNSSVVAFAGDFDIDLSTHMLTGWVNLGVVSAQIISARVDRF
jgi:hypothetical protein